MAEAFAGAADESTVTLDDSAYAAILDRYLGESASGINTFDYAAVTPEDRALLRGYIAEMTALDPTLLTGDQKIAYWSNLYNAVTLDVVLAAMPVESIRDIELRDTGDKIAEEGVVAGVRQVFTDDGPWKAKVVVINGLPVSLDDMEHEVLRKMGEPRVHYAVNCASYSCPDLRAEPWSAEGLDAALDAAAAEYVNHPRAVSVDDEGRLVLSSIYDWFSVDFGDTPGDVVAHLQAYATGETAGMLKAAEISGYDYNWTLNSPDAVTAVEADRGES